MSLRSLTDHTLVMMKKDGLWVLTPGSDKRLRQSVLNHETMYETLKKYLEHRANTQHQDEIHVGCSHSSYSIIKPR